MVVDADLLQRGVDLDGVNVVGVCASACATSLPLPAPTISTLPNLWSGNQR